MPVDDEQAVAGLVWWCWRAADVGAYRRGCHVLSRASTLPLFAGANRCRLPGLRPHRWDVHRFVSGGLKEIRIDPTRVTRL